MREAKPWPASTALLVVSVLFANKLWIMDVTSMSLYWVARLPFKRPKGQTSTTGSADESVRVGLASAGRSRQWKIALSLAIVGALAAPFVFGTYKARPTYSVWVPLEAQQKENLAAYLQNSKGCRRETGLNGSVCRQLKEELEADGKYEDHPDLFIYLTLNVGVAAATFISIFGLAFLIPMLFRGVALLVGRYWKWLNA